MLLYSTDATAVTVVNIDNIFTSTYLNYLVEVVPTAILTASGQTITLVFRSGGVTQRVAAYINSALTLTGTTVSGTSSSTDSYHLIGSAGTGSVHASETIIHNPLSTSTVYGKGYKSRSFAVSSGQYKQSHISGLYPSSTSMDGFAIESSQTMNVLIRVYGYAN